MFKYFVSALFGLGLTSAAAADIMCDWRIEGQVLVEHQMPVPMFTDETGPWREGFSPLAGIEVRIRGNAPNVPGWVTWDRVFTDDEGRFVYEERKTCNRRVLRVDVKFANDDLRIIRAADSWFDGDNETFEQLSPWYTIINDRADDKIRTNTTINLSPRVFGPDRNHEQGDEKAYQRADIWVAMTEMMNELEDMGSAYEFQDRVNIAYPLFEEDFEGINPFAVPYSSGLTFITGGYFNLATVYHEVGHIWAYQQSRGEGCLASELAYQGLFHGEDTHTITRDACPSFHEGFAEFFGQHLANRVMGADESLPAARFYLADFIEGQTDPETDETGVPNLSTAARIDRGWQSLLFMMTTPRLQTYDFLTQDDDYSDGKQCGDIMSGFHDSSCVRPSASLQVCFNPIEEASFQDILSLFQSHSSQGYYNRLTTDDLTLASFLERARSILDNVDADTVSTYQTLLDPSRTDTVYQAHDCGTPTMTGPVNIGGASDPGPNIPNGRTPYDPGDGNPGPGDLGGRDIPDPGDDIDLRTATPTEENASMRAGSNPDSLVGDRDRPETGEEGSEETAAGNDRRPSRGRSRRPE